MNKMGKTNLQSDQHLRSNPLMRWKRAFVLFDFSLTVKAAPHECVIRTGQP